MNGANGVGVILCTPTIFSVAADSPCAKANRCDGKVRVAQTGCFHRFHSFLETIAREVWGRKNFSSSDAGLQAASVL